ncbi:MAG: tRNA (N(6)-L-threonylcarbamoyladenosine(37)-C(2))-methylthiotransferase MtaB [Treponema sp.]|jgi:threonylcarbamoyladenosine tRNA methylthiotransferase MtaB|nr:tRNA (N(6)-L-threonylcarbamoyladenosine(37)-C(2))-methylthiotransferase MtaB [Treponema sp.]
MHSILIQTLGCKLNQLESEAYADAFSRAGFSFFEQAGEERQKASPSIIIVNTCTVTSKADQKARRVIRKALRDYPEAFVFVTGCYAQLDHEEIGRLDTETGGRLFVLKGGKKNALLELPARINQCKNDLHLAVKAFSENNDLDTHFSAPVSGSNDRAFQFSPERFSRHTRSFLKIQDGCDRHCTYCRVRLARGPSISLESDRVLERLRTLEESHAEAVLTGVNICQYRDGAVNSLGELLENILAGTKKISIRLSSLEPDNIDESFAKILSNKRIRPHFHLSIQSGSEKILKKMGRDYNTGTIEKAIDLLRNTKDDPFIACDIIAGFPGETDVEFRESYELCKKMNFAWIHVFPYSKRPGTPAFYYPETVNTVEVSNRVQLLTNLAWECRERYIKSFLGREVEALAEKGEAKKGTGTGVQGFKFHCRGISENYLKLFIQCKGEKIPPPGTVMRCKLLKSQEIDCLNEDYDALAQEL